MDGQRNTHESRWCSTQPPSAGPNSSHSPALQRNCSMSTSAIAMCTPRTPDLLGDESGICLFGIGRVWEVDRSALDATCLPAGNLFGSRLGGSQRGVPHAEAYPG